MGGVSGGGSAGGDLAYVKIPFIPHQAFRPTGRLGGFCRVPQLHRPATATRTRNNSTKSTNLQLQSLYAGRSDWWVQGPDAVSHAGAILPLTTQLSMEASTRPGGLFISSGRRRQRGLLNSGQTTIELMNYGRAASRNTKPSSITPCKPCRLRKSLPVRLPTGFTGAGGDDTKSNKLQLARQTSATQNRGGHRVWVRSVGSESEPGLCSLNARTGLGYAGLAEGLLQIRLAQTATDQFSYQSCSRSQLHQDQMNNTDKAFQSDERLGWFRGGGGAGAGASWWLRASVLIPALWADLTLRDMATQALPSPS